MVVWSYTVTREAPYEDVVTGIWQSGGAALTSGVAVR